MLQVKKLANECGKKQFGCLVLVKIDYICISLAEIQKILRIEINVD